MKNILYFLLLFLCQELTAQNKLIPFRKDSLWGFANEKREMVIPCQYQEAYPFSEGLALVAKLENFALKYGFINSKGKTIIPLDYDWGHSFQNGFAYVEQYNDKGNFWGVINQQNKAMIPIENMCAPIPMPVIEDMGFEEGFMSVMRITDMNAYEMGVRNDQGKMVIPFGKYEYIGKFREGLAEFRKSYNGNAGYINTQGEIVIEPAYYTASEFSEDLARVRTANVQLDQEDFLMGFVDKTGNMVIPMEYYTFANFSEGLVPVAHQSNPSKEGCIDKTGKTIIPFEYDKIAGFRDGISAAVKNGKLGYINPKNEVLIPFQYDYTPDSELTYHNFYEGKATVIKNGKYGFIDIQGNIVIDFKYIAVGDLFNYFPYFKNGVVMVKNTVEGLPFYIDAQGREYVED